MKIFISKISFALLLMLTSCGGSRKLGSNALVSISNRSFIFESSIRTMNFVFDTTDCQLTITYKCPNIIKEHESVNIKCTYKQLNDSMVVIKNKLQDTKAEQIDLTPPKEELAKCVSSGLPNDKNNGKVSASGNDDGFIPIINIDTIKVISKKDKLFLYLSKRRGQAIYNFLWKEK